MIRSDELDCSGHLKIEDDGQVLLLLGVNNPWTRTVPHEISGRTLGRLCFATRLESSVPAMDSLRVYSTQLLANQSSERVLTPTFSELTGMCVRFRPVSARHFFGISSIDFALNGSLYPRFDMSGLKSSSETGRLLKGVHVQVGAFSEGFNESSAQLLKDSSYDQPALTFQFEEPIEFAAGHAVLVALRCLLGLTASAGKWGGVEGVEVCTLSSDGQSMWSRYWSADIMCPPRLRSTLPETDTENGNLPFPWQAALQLTLEDLDGPSGLCRWLEMMVQSPHVLSVLDQSLSVGRRSLRSFLVTLATAWEHFAASSTGKERGDKAIWRTISKHANGDTRLEKLLELAWATNNEIKHFKSRKGVITLHPFDETSHQTLTSVMLYALIAATLESAACSQAAALLVFAISLGECREGSWSTPHGAELTQLWEKYAPPPS